MNLPPGELAVFNGQFLSRAEVCLPIHDAGFVFGATVTDLCRTFNHRLFRLTDHLVRFRKSCDAAHISQPIRDQELTEYAEELVRHNAEILSAGHDLALVMIATPGDVSHYAGTSKFDSSPATL